MLGETLYRGYVARRGHRVEGGLRYENTRIFCVAEEMGNCVSREYCLSWGLCGENREKRTWGWIGSARMIGGLENNGRGEGGDTKVI